MLVPVEVDDAALLRRQRQFLEEVERKIAEANREILQEHIPELNQARFVSLAKQVARLRAAYLQAALGAQDETDPETFVRELRSRREAYDEARDAFEALQRAIQRGYVDIGQSVSGGA
ncbi:MAG TPA: hypothetical protein VMN39_10820 [Longimicrobiaceae bacterium]|nr:hypothetical protein [Longimicrobiaceae bacterium]